MSKIRNLLLAAAVLVCSAGRAEEFYSVHGPLPSGHQEDAIIAFSHLYTVAIDPESKIAIWCAYEITPGMFEGRNSLNRNWINSKGDRGDVLLEHQDYSGSGYDIGHLAPLASFSANQWAYELNWMGNVAPQRPNLNRGPWLRIENRARELAVSAGRVHVIVGPLFEGDMPPLPNADEEHVVPSHYWAILKTDDGHEAFIVPQDAPRTIDGDDPLEPYRSTTEQIQDRAGLRF